MIISKDGMRYTYNVTTYTIGAAVSRGYPGAGAAVL